MTLFIVGVVFVFLMGANMQLSAFNIYGVEYICVQYITFASNKERLKVQ